jgi:DNA-binding response OmpR family regulator
VDRDGFKNGSPPFELDEEGWLQIAKMAEMGLSAGAVAHEARQPLSALKMTLQLMRDGSDDLADMKERLDNALEQTERLERLLAQLRNFLLPNAQARTEVDLAGLVDGVLTLLRGGLKNKKVDILNEFEPNLPRVVIERHKIEQVVFNLIVNAKDAVLESGGGRIVVLVFKDAADSVKLVVADDGPGIDPSVADKIFQPYFSTKGKDKGTGLGLYIARRIADQHGAAIELLGERARANLGYGKLSTAFQISFVLPRQRLTIPPPVPTVKRGNSALVVSDDEVEIGIIEEIIAGEGYRCSSVLSGEEALSLIEGGPLDLLVVSGSLGDMTGLEIARLTRNLNPLMPILLITDGSKEELEKELAAMRRAGSVKRPLDAAELKSMVRYLTGTDRSRPDMIDTGGPKNGASVDGKSSDASREEASAQSPRVVIIEIKEEIREKIETILKTLGCEVTAFASEEEVDSNVGKGDCDVLVADIAVLKNRIGRLPREPRSGHAPAYLAIMDSGGIDKTIEAIHLGANGVFFPPFEEDRVALELKRAVGWRVDE